MDKLDIKALARHIKENNAERAQTFNEDSLRADIIDRWGEHGAHADVYDRILNELDLVREDRDRWLELSVKLLEANSRSLDLADELDAVRLDRDRWRSAAESLERDHGQPGYAKMAYEEQDAWNDILEGRHNSDKLQGWIDEMVATDAEWVDAEDYDTSDIDTEYGYDESDPEED